MSGWPWRSNAVRAAAIAAALLAPLAARLLAPITAEGAAQKQKVSSAPVTCATCHAKVVNDFAHAPMRHAMEPEGADPVLDANPDLRIEQRGYSYRIQTKDGKSTYTVSDGKETLTLPLRWHFGMRAQTWVLEKDGKFYEGLVSYFPGIHGLATTPGDDKIEPHTVAEAMGRELPVWETRDCFECHATGMKVGAVFTPEKLKPGLDCEHCHEGTAQHMADAQAGNFKTLPVSLKKMDAESVSGFCGQCHRSFDTVIRNGWHGPPFVRFAPYRLSLSRCFSGNDARISCLACHDPHQPVNHDTASYDKKCLACHSGSATVASVGAAEAAPKTCPVAKANCTSCHMQKVTLPTGNLQFTDHFIRIVKPGEAYPH
ncbi:cytochrome c3 family protein [Terracidiphilus gabretensis]|uniref:cytochrome c3 family protein n=1 Tax=Terracidiphilus gabretensis TaxID=1577687 RepID=UPI00071B4772|nr:cytochrome c3 family protein [Terracidiphilus gabretensis]